MKSPVIKLLQSVGGTQIFHYPCLKLSDALPAQVETVADLFKCKYRLPEKPVTPDEYLLVTLRKCTQYLMEHFIECSLAHRISGNFSRSI